MKAERATPVIAQLCRSHEDATIESFTRDPAYAAEYLKAVLEDGDTAELRVALKRMSRAIAGQPATAEVAE